MDDERCPGETAPVPCRVDRADGESEPAVNVLRDLPHGVCDIEWIGGGERRPDRLQEAPAAENADHLPRLAAPLQDPVLELRGLAVDAVRVVGKDLRRPPVPAERRRL